MENSEVRFRITSIAYFVAAGASFDTGLIRVKHPLIGPISQGNAGDFRLRNYKNKETRHVTPNR